MRQWCTRLKAAQEAAALGIDVAVVDLRTLLPLDVNAIRETAARTGKVLCCTRPVARAGSRRDRGPHCRARLSSI